MRNKILYILLFLLGVWLYSPNFTYAETKKDTNINIPIYKIEYYQRKLDKKKIEKLQNNIFSIYGDYVKDVKINKKCKIESNNINISCFWKTFKDIQPIENTPFLNTLDLSKDINENSCKSLNKDISFFWRYLDNIKGVKINIKFTDTELKKLLGCYLYKNNKKYSTEQKMTTIFAKYRKTNINLWLDSLNISWNWNNTKLSIVNHLEKNGDKYVDGLAIVWTWTKLVSWGGLCWVSTMFFDACLYWLDKWCKIDTYRHHSQFYHAYYPFPWWEATIFFSKYYRQDLILENKLDYNIYVVPFSYRVWSKFIYWAKFYSFWFNYPKKNKIEASWLNDKCWKYKVLWENGEVLKEEKVCYKKVE